MSDTVSDILPIPILFEDQDLWVFSKPAGLIVNDADTHQTQSVQTMLRQVLLSRPPVDKNTWQNLVPEDFDSQWGTPEEIFTNRAGMVHRLDKNTSGCLVWAKNPGSLVNLMAQFRLRQVQKEYIALVHGLIEPEVGTIDLPLARNPANRMRIGVHPAGRPAVTQYQVLAKYHNQAGHQFSLITCRPQTGRMHQIRAHLSHLGHPLVGDSLYLGHKTAKKDKAWCPRQFLHASAITLTAPRTGQKVSVIAGLAPDLSRVLALLQTRI